MNIAANIYTAVGPLVGNRAWPEEAPEGAALPFIVFRQTDMIRFETIDKMSTVAVLEKYVIDIWADTRADASTLASAIMSAMLALDPTPMPNQFDALGWDFDPETGLNAATLEYSIPNTL